jgi:hypothetical protein
MSAAGRCYGPSFSPRGYWAEVTPVDVQAELRRAFSHWGLPERFRVDNGVPWGSWGDLPTDLVLWLIGLGVGVDWNPPRRPQDNGVVERSQGTAKRWAEPWTCATAAELQQRLKEMDGIQRQEYPSVGGRSRLEAFPELLHSERPYTRTWERTHWSLAAVTAYVAGHVVPRRVDKSGTVSVYNRNHYVGKIHAQKAIHVMLDPEIREWIFADEGGQQLRVRPATEISRRAIIGLMVTNRRNRTNGQ